MRLWAAGVVLAFGIGFFAGACGGDDTSAEGCPGPKCCEPNAIVLCTCKGADRRGSKQCNGEGSALSACVADDGGECEEIPNTTTTGEGGSTSTSSTGGNGAGGNATGSKDLLEPCGSDGECKSGMCPFGECTQDCASFDECPADIAECVAFGNMQVCHSTCGYVAGPPKQAIPDALDVCAMISPDSSCGYAKAADAYDVLVCAPWGANVPTTPDGWDCDSNTWGDTQCNLGHESPGVEVVCAFGACTAGCYEDKDCPSGTNCANPGNLSTCQ